MVVQSMRRWARMAVAVLATSAGVLALSTGPAHAGGWQLTDGFEYQPASTWTVEHYGVGGGGFDYNNGAARSGQNDGWVWAQTQFSSIGRSVTLRNNLSRISCGAGIYINGSVGAKVNFEIINPSNWTYVALKSVTIGSAGYQQVTVGPWTGGPNTVYVRVSIGGIGVTHLIRVDDLVVQCTY